MIKQVLIIVVVAVVAGLIVYQYVGALPLTETLQPVWTRLQETWANIPGTVKSIITLAVPSAFAMFFMWTKTRAMQKLQETQQQASQQINQLQGEKQMLQQQVGQSASKGIEDLIQARDMAFQSRDEAQALVTKLQREMELMQNRHLGEVASLKQLIEEYKPKEVINVK